MSPGPSVGEPDAEVQAPAHDARPLPTDEAGPALPDKPSIVVLPFSNLSGDTSQDYFIDGLVDDITVALGRERWLFVIASPSAFVFKDRAADPREVGARMGVRYVLRGSVRKSSNRVRISVQLFDAVSGALIWSDRCEDETDNVFDMHDRLTARVAAMIAPTLRSVEIERVQRKPTRSVTAFDLYLQALPLFRTSLADNRRRFDCSRRPSRSIPHTACLCVCGALLPLPEADGLDAHRPIQSFRRALV